MSVRQLDYGWDGVLDKLINYHRQVAVAAALTEVGGGWQLLSLTIRGGPQLTECEWRYGPLRIFRRVQPANQAATILYEKGLLTITIPQLESAWDSRGYWVTRGTDHGMIAPASTPRLHHSHYWQQAAGQSYAFNPYQPLAAPGQPYYPTAIAALQEVLFGRTDEPRSADPQHRFEVSLAFDSAFLGEVGYVQDEGLVIKVEGSSPSGAADHELQAVWRLHSSETEYQRWRKVLTASGVFTVPVKAPPLSYSVALIDRSGHVVDNLDGQGPPALAYELPLAPTALPEAFDFLDAAWRLFFGCRLIERPMLRGVADLTQPVGSREDFMSRMTHLDDLMKALRVDDDLIPPKAAKSMAPTASLGRMRVAIHRKLRGTDIEGVDRALETLSAANDVRVALQHKLSPSDKRPDLPTALRRLRIQYPPDWLQAWEVIKRQVIDAVDEIRRALLNNLPT